MVNRSNKKPQKLLGNNYLIFRLAKELKIDFFDKQVTRGHNIVADGWAGAANPHPHPMLHPTPLPTQTHTQKASKTLVFPLFDSC